MRRCDRRRVAPALLVLSSLFGGTGCYNYRLRSADDTAAGVTQTHVLHSFFWGAIQGQAPYHHCALHGQAGGNGLWQVNLHPTGADVIAKVLTLGIWAPLHVAYDCAPERPRLDIATASAVQAAAVTVSDAEPVDDRGCYRDRPWENISGKVRVTPRWLCVPKPGTGAGAQARADPLVRLVREAEAEHLPVRALGAGWSFSSAPAGKGYMIDMRWFGGALAPPPASDIAPAAAARSFAHVEAGAAVDAINLALEKASQQMLTMGGSAGQTWVGAVQTGTHGSAIDLAPIADHVWALQVIGEGGARTWIESATRPLTNGAYARSQGAAFVQDDDVFWSALAGLGTFGIVYSAVIEVEPLTDYKRYRSKLPLDSSLITVMKSLDFTTWKDSPKPGQRPYHFEVVVDPYNATSNAPTAYVTTLWNAGPHLGGAPPAAGLVPSDALGNLLRKLVNADPSSVPQAVALIMAGTYKTIGDEEPPSPLRYLFPKGIPQGSKPQSAEFDFPRDRLDVALSVVLRTIADHRMVGGSPFYYPGVLGIRFVKQTNALLGATVYPDTVTVEFAGIPGVYGLEDFYRRVDDALSAASVPHTQHLGQANTYAACPQRLRVAFTVDAKDRIESYRAARARFLSPAAQTTFSNEYTDALGLTGKAIPAGPCAAAAP